jgi:cytochrome c553
MPVKYLISSAALLASLAMSATSIAADTDKISVGRDKARQCSVCHGKIGVSNDP